MATRRCCSGCNGSYGALNCVPSPYGFNCRNYPYYTGPCAQICGDERFRPIPPWEFEPTPPPPNPPTPTAFTQAYGYFTAVPPLTVSAGGAIPLSTTLANSSAFTNSSGSILIRRSGIYLVSYTVQLGTSDDQSTQYYLSLNGTTIGESAVNVVSDGGTTETASYTVNAIIRANANSTLTLNSTSELSVVATATNPYSLTIVRIA